MHPATKIMPGTELPSSTVGQSKAGTAIDNNAAVMEPGGVVLIAVSSPDRVAIDCSYCFSSLTVRWFPIFENLTTLVVPRSIYCHSLAAVHIVGLV